MIGAALLAAAAVIIGILSFGMALPLSIGLAMGAVGLIVGGANMLAQAAGLPSLGSAIEKAMQQGGMSQDSMLATSASVFALSVILTIASFGALSFMDATVASMSVAVVTGLAGTLGMEMMSQAFQDSITQNFENQGMNSPQAQQDTQAIMGAITALIVLVGLGKGLSNMVRAIPRLFTETFALILSRDQTLIVNL